MNTTILGGNPIREKTTAAVVSVFNIYYKENFLQCCTGTDSYQHAGTHVQKAATFSRSPATTGLELQPPDLVYQPLLEGSYYPLLSFTSLSWKGATTPLHSFTSLFWKGATTPCTRLPATTRRELQPPHWRLRPSVPLRTMFHRFSYWIQQLPYNTTCWPLFIRFSD